MKNLILSFVLIVLFFHSALQASSQLDFSSFSSIAILHDGRIKPLDTFARHYLLIFSGKQKLAKQTAIQWLAEVIFEGESALNNPIFKVSNPELHGMLDLPLREGNRYSYNEITPGLIRVIATIQSLLQREQSELSPAEVQLVDLFLKIEAFVSLYTSMSVISTENSLEKSELAKQYQVMDLLKIIPNQWQLLSDGSQDSHLAQTKMLDIDWHSPAVLLQSGAGSPQSAQYLVLWEKLAKAYQNKDSVDWTRTSGEIRAYWKMLIPHHLERSKISAEVMYNKLDLFTNSFVFYILAFLLLAVSWLVKPSVFSKLALVSMGIGWLAHLCGILLRIYVMGRSPVATLYESIIFVALITVAFAFYLEISKKNGIGLLIGSISGVLLLLISFGYQNDGDTMGMLVAVLNTNFWLTAHVLTIAIGYGCVFVASLLSHLYLIGRLRSSSSMNLAEISRPQVGRQKIDVNDLIKNIRGITLFALFFCVLGTVLGGIWADQSWGRFWGWDPKENGAFLICVWLILLIHGKHNKIFDDLGFAIGMVTSNIIVALAWFGVNLLNVGLHSYGFAGNVAAALGAFCGIEFLFILVFYFLIKKHESAFHHEN